MLNKLYHYQKRCSEYIKIEVNKFLEGKVMNEYLSLFFAPPIICMIIFDLKKELKQVDSIIIKMDL